MARIRTAILCVCILGFAFPNVAQSGEISWGPWDFEWEIDDNSGLALKKVRYKNDGVLYRASMPVIRVKYDNNACGPWNDHINLPQLDIIPSCDNVKICERSFFSSGRNWLEIWVYATIGEYHLLQLWYLSDDGWIHPRLYSSGLQCQVNHDHHVYWRLDFDIRDHDDDQVFVFDNDRPDEGWGPGWHKYTNELNSTKNSATNRKWFVRDPPHGGGVWIIPGPDGVADAAFSNKDVAPRLWRKPEESPWPFPAETDGDFFNNGQNISEKDIVFWYIAHLSHDASEGKDHWGWVGPWIKVQSLGDDHVPF